MKKIIPLIILQLLPIFLMAQPRSVVIISGLRDDPDYMELIREDERLQHIEDSLTTVMENLRLRFRGNLPDREEYAGEILRLEAEIFDVRNKIGITAGRITAIENEFLISRLAADDIENSGPVSLVTGPEDRGGFFSEGERSLLFNPVFSSGLGAEDLAELRNADAREKAVMDIYRKYVDNYRKLSSIHKAYSTTDIAAVADSLYGLYDSVSRTAHGIEQEILHAWEPVYDTKIYCYDYLFQKNRDQVMLARMENKLSESRDRLARLRERSHSQPVITYAIQKSMLLSLEKEIALNYKYIAALDSLSTAELAFNSLTIPMPLLELEQRVFLDYQDIEVTSPSRYTTRNPIPETVIYPRGVIYRVLVGSYARVQPISLFKGLYPLSVMSEDNRFYYYAGGYRSEEEAEAGLEAVKRLGFRYCRVVCWENGEITTAPAQRPVRNTDADVPHRVEIHGISGDLSESDRDIIAEASRGRELSRAGDVYIVGVFNNASSAERFVQRIKESHPQWELRTVVINTTE